MTSVKFALLQTLLGLLKSIDFTPQPGDEVRKIEPSAIIYRKFGPGAKSPAALDSIDLPAVVLTSSRRTEIPNSGGTNERDQYNIRFIAQILSPEIINTDKNIDSYWIWQQRIARAFNNQVNVNWNLPPDGSCVQQVLVEEVDEIDQKEFVAYQNAVCGVVILFQTWQPRGF